MHEGVWEFSTAVNIPGLSANGTYDGDTRNKHVNVIFFALHYIEPIGVIGNFSKLVLRERVNESGGA